MAIVLFILIAGLWAAFLLPSFFDHRNSAPRSTTRDFARTRKKLAEVAMAHPDSDVYMRRHTQYRRQRILIGLAVASLSTLVIATWTGSVAWLTVNIAIDVSIAAYVTILLTLKKQRLVPSAQVVQISVQAPAQEPARLTAVPDQAYADSQTVRVIAG